LKGEFYQTFEMSPSLMNNYQLSIINYQWILIKGKKLIVLVLSAISKEKTKYINKSMISR